MLDRIQVMMDADKVDGEEQNIDLYMEQIGEQTEWIEMIYQRKDQLSPHNRCFLETYMSGDRIFGINRYSYYMASIRRLQGMGDNGSSDGNKKRIALWGCGKLGRKFIDALNDSNNSIDYVLDEDRSKQGHNYGGYLIQNYDDIKYDIDAVIVLNPRYIDEVRDRIEDRMLLSRDDL